MSLDMKLRYPSYRRRSWTTARAWKWSCSGPRGCRRTTPRGTSRSGNSLVTEINKIELTNAQTMST